MVAGRNLQPKQASEKLNTYASMALWGNSPEGRIVFGRHWSGDDLEWTGQTNKGIEAAQNVEKRS